MSNYPDGMRESDIPGYWDIECPECEGEGCDHCDGTGTVDSRDEESDDYDDYDGSDDYNGDCYCADCCG